MLLLIGGGVGEHSTTIGVTLVYPNPCNGMITLTSSYQAKNYRILTLDGRIVQAGVIGAQLDFSVLKNGMYFLHIETEGGLVMTQQLQKL